MHTEIDLDEKLVGGCQCGALRYEITEAPQLTYTCHCIACQRLTSSAFSMAVVVASEAFRLIKGEPRSIQRTAESGRLLTRWVCSECGSWISGAPQPGSMVRVRAGTLDDTSGLRPKMHFWTKSAQPWVVLTDDAEKFETQPANLESFFSTFTGDKNAP